MSARLPRAVLAALAILLAAGAASGCGGAGGGQPRSVRVVGPLTDVRPDQPTPAGTSGASLLAARNEFESFQVVVDAGPRALRRVSVAPAGPLRGPGGDQIPATDLSVYREVPYEIGPRGPFSDAESEAGGWPDALIPVRDQFYGERRDALPVHIDGGDELAVWIDVFVAPARAPGVYRGSVLVTSAAGRLARVPVRVRVLPFALPSTSTLENSFGFEWSSVCLAHTGSPTCHGDRRKAWLLSSLYARSALDDRVTISNPFPLNDGDPPSEAERGLFDKFILPLLTGSGSLTKLHGARLTSAATYAPCVLARDGCLQRWRRLASEGGFGDNFFVYACNEPEDEEQLWEECRQAARIAARRWPGVRKLASVSIGEALSHGGTSEDPEAGLRKIDTMAVLINDMANRPETETAGDQRSDYEPFLEGAYGASPGIEKRLWLYSSCQSDGCTGEMGDPAGFVGWPGYAIDQPPSQARAMGWMAFEYEAMGELYYQTTSLLPTAWTDSFRSGGNGDGTLFYPGLPGGGPGIPAIGGRHDIPIDSIRLKRIRDGREDYEYLHLLASMGLKSQAEQVVESLFGDPDLAMFNTTVEEGALQAARRQLAEMIVRGG